MGVIVLRRWVAARFRVWRMVAGWPEKRAIRFVRGRRIVSWA
ncbi:hypothetical protein [Saccharothrix sp.]|nr:hypothetical protein [Saccharothrix sp.]